MHERFIEELQNNQKPFVLLEGDRETRLRNALKECDVLLREQGTI
jgi:hypothetical protein